MSAATQLDLDEETKVALEVARSLAKAGAPIFLARPELDMTGLWIPDGGHGKTGYFLPPRWQHTEADASVIDDWRPGMAVCVVTGVVLDGVDVDVHKEGATSAQSITAAGCWPQVIGRQQTPSGGWHDVVNVLGVRSRDGVEQGLDVKSGRQEVDVDDAGRGFLFLAPTVKLSKVTGEIGCYRWTLEPNLDEIDPADDSGDALAIRIEAMRDPQRAAAQDLPHDAYDAMTTAQQDAVARYLAALVRRTGDELAKVATWPIGYRDKPQKRGWQKVLADVCNRFGQLARADWTPWDYAIAYQRLGTVVPAPIATAVGLEITWGAQRKRRAPAPYPATLATPEVDYPPAFDPGPDDNPTLETDRYAEADNMFGGQMRIAHRLAAAEGHRLMFVHSVGWHYWAGTHWAEDDRGRADRAVVEVLRSALADSYRDNKLRADVAKCETANGVAGVLKLAESIEVFAATAGDLDSDPYLLNCANGTLDLRSRQVSEHDPRDRITKVCVGAYRPGARSCEWDAFLATVLPDEAERAYLQRVVGSALLGKVEEHLFPILTGTGANGKGTAYGAVGHAVGAYGIVVDPELLMVKDHGGGTTEMLDLRGARIVFASETGAGRNLDEVLMKRLAGGDKLRGRRLYKDPVEWEPSHQLVYVTNHLPKVKGDDPAPWRRIQVIPFDVTIPEADRDVMLSDRLRLVADEVLVWAVEGYFDYRDNGMRTPESVRAATTAYQVESDAVRRFVEQGCITSSSAAARTSELYAAWQKWAQGEDVEPMSDKAFGKELDRLGYPARKTKTGAVRVGITPSETQESDQFEARW